MIDQVGRIVPHPPLSASLSIIPSYRWRDGRDDGEGGGRLAGSDVRRPVWLPPVARIDSRRGVQLNARSSGPRRDRQPPVSAASPAGRSVERPYAAPLPK